MPRKPVKKAPTYFHRRGRTRKDGYGAKRTYSDMIGRHFPSALERRVGETLWLRQKAGEISDLTFQPRVLLIDADDAKNRIRMIPDFRYVEDGRTIWHEAKGNEDARWLLQVRLWSQFGPGEYHVTFGGTKPMRIIHPKLGKALCDLVRRRHDS